jgi:beta-glucanase (GH16 family)
MIKTEGSNKYIKMIKLTMVFNTIVCLSFSFGCKINNEPEFNADFDYEFIDDNHIRFTNLSEGEYYSLTWDFGNGESETTNDKKKNYNIYYHQAGEYEVSLRLTNYSGSNQITKKSFNISKDDPNYEQDSTLVWSDEFDGSTVNTDNWTFEVGATGWGNNELQNYTNGYNSEVVNGNLIITVRKVDDNMQAGSYTSSRMVTKNKQEFQYGKIEIRAKLPEGTGIWPAIWMLGSNIGSVGWPECGETDIMEYVGFEPNTVHSTVHTPDGYGASGNGSSMIVNTCEEEFHIYGLNWTDSKLEFYVDSPENIVHTYAPPIKTNENWPFDQPAFFILNVAVGGNWGGLQGIDNSIFPQKMIIDYVRVYQ